MTRVVLMHLWPRSETSTPSHQPIQDVVKQLGIKSNISTLYRTYDTLLSLAPVEVLEQYQDERANLEEEMWYDTIRVVQSGSGLRHVVDTVFLPLYSSFDKNWAQKSFDRCKTGVQRQGILQCT